MTQRIFRNRKYVRHRIDKTRYTNRDKIVITTETPTGKIIETRTAEYKTDKRIVPNEENGNWETAELEYGLKIRHSKTSDRYWLFFRDQFLTEVTELGLYHLYMRGLGHVKGFTEIVQKIVKGKAYKRYVLKGEAAWKREHGM